MNKKKWKDWTDWKLAGTPRSGFMGMNVFINQRKSRNFTNNARGRRRNRRFFLQK
jgi:hypothetical protein